MSYFGKTAYKGDIAINYQQDRMVEPIWGKEQQWMSDFLQNVNDNAVILDIPVGSGRFLELYASKKLEIFGMDISADMVAVSQLAQDGIINKNAVVKLSVGDAENLDMADNAVDYIFCFRLFHLIPFVNIKKILKEFHRVSKGPVVIEVFNSSLLQKQDVSLSSGLKKIKQKLKRVLFAPKDSPAEMPNAWAHITNFSYPHHLLIKAIKSAGFKNIDTQKIDDGENPATIFILNK